MSCENPTPEPKAPFIIKCLSDECTVVHAGTKTYTAGQLEDEINSGSEFGRKLKEARDEVANL
jgi:hypothetical protein